MGENTRTTRKLNSWFWFIMYMLPIIVFLFAIFRSSTAITPENITTYLQGFLGDTVIPSANAVKSGIIGIFEEIFGTSVYVNIGVSLGLWMVLVKLIHLVVDVIGFLPDVVCRLINGIPGGKEV